MIVRRCLEKDLDQVLAVERACFKHPYDRSLFKHHLGSGEGGFIVGEDGGRIVSYAIFETHDDRGLIVSIAVLPEFRRRGLGTRLFEYALQQLSSKASSVRLQVGVGNLGAIGFYENFGFTRLGIVRRYYPDGEDALLMEKKL